MSRCVGQVLGVSKFALHFFAILLTYLARILKRYKLQKLENVLVKVSSLFTYLTCSTIHLFFVLYTMLPVSQDCSFLLVPSVFSNVYLSIHTRMLRCLGDSI